MFANQRNNRQEPIQSNTEDKLNRSIFVNYVTNIIKNAPTTNRAFVLSINGKWGEGKTSVKNLIAERLLYNKKSSNNMLLEFSSIEFQTQKELNKIFLDKVVNIVKGKNKNMEIIESIKENKGIILTILFLVLTIVGVIYPNVFVRLSSLIFSIIFIFRAQFRKITLNTLMEVLSKSYVKIDVVHRILYYDELKVYNVEDLKLKKYLETKCKYNKIIILIDNFDSLEPNQVKMLIQLINSKLNLMNEGIDIKNIFVTGSPMYEVLQKNMQKIKNSQVLQRLNLKPREYILVSAHREENIDIDENFMLLANSINAVAKKYNIPIIYSTHPRTMKKINKTNFKFDELVNNVKPFGFIDYTNLEMNALFVLSDSGTLTEESSMLNFNGILFRTSTERPEGLDDGTIIISGIDKNSVLSACQLALEIGNDGKPNQNYSMNNVSDKVVKIIQSYTNIINKTVLHKK